MVAAAKVQRRKDADETPFDLEESNQEESPRQRRKDPPIRQFDGTVAWTRIGNKDPHRKYIFANPNDKFTMAQYRTSGYRVEKHSELGPDGNPVGVYLLGMEPGTPGTEIGAMDMVLISCSLERHEEIEKYGHDGTGGMNRVEHLDRLIKGTGHADDVRQVDGYGRYMTVRRDTFDGRRHGEQEA